jgi:hypothetical protein
MAINESMAYFSFLLLPTSANCHEVFKHEVYEVCKYEVWVKFDGYASSPIIITIVVLLCYGLGCFGPIVGCFVGLSSPLALSMNPLCFSKCRLLGALFGVFLGHCHHSSLIFLLGVFMVHCHCKSG